MIATTEPEYDDFNRSTQILLRHGFVFKGMPQDQQHPAPTTSRRPSENSQKSRSLSPVGVAPSSRVGEAHVLGRPYSDGVVPLRRVTWDLSDLAGCIPELPFATKQQPPLPQPESSSSSSLSRASNKKLLRRSTVAAADVAKRIVLNQERQELELLRQLHSSSANNDHQTSSQHNEHNIEAPTMQRRKSSRERRALKRRSTATTVNMSNETWVDEILRNESEEKIMPQKNEVPCIVEQLRPYNGYRDDYFLGDVVRSTSHMIIESTPKLALGAVESLHVHDFAWVKRSDGLYTYAILAYRSTCPLTIESSCAVVPSATAASSSEGEEYMYFVVDHIGSTKMVPKSRWHVNVRLIHETSID
ncbi:hypothetical protein ACHAWU_004881 [Discostella pseudostelligera]|uniref:Uncharacterized protein n=1 Tax=Discostella pseudostelligera TaxID=259834 RepID=A0ABD3M5V9_9STRA